MKNTELQIEIFLKDTSLTLLKKFVESLAEVPDIRAKMVIDWDAFMLVPDGHDIDEPLKNAFWSEFKKLDNQTRNKVTEVMYDISVFAENKIYDRMYITTLVDREPIFQEAWKPFAEKIKKTRYNCAMAVWLHYGVAGHDVWKAIKWYIADEDLPGTKRQYKCAISCIVNNYSEHIQDFRDRVEACLRDELKYPKCHVLVEAPDAYEEGKFRLLVHYSRIPKPQRECTEKGEWSIGYDISSGLISIVFIQDAGCYHVRSNLPTSTSKKIAGIFSECLLQVSSEQVELILGRLIDRDFTFSKGDSGKIESIKPVMLRLKPGIGNNRELLYQDTGDESIMPILDTVQSEIGDRATCEVKAARIEFLFNEPALGRRKLTLSKYRFDVTPYNVDAYVILFDLIKRTWGIVK